jgi:hypothetical protein
MADKGSYGAKDVAKGKIRPSEIEGKYVILWDTGKSENMGKAANIMAGEGWTVKGCWGGVNINTFIIFEKS